MFDSSVTRRGVITAPGLGCVCLFLPFSLVTVSDSG